MTTKTRKTIFATIGGLSAFSIILVSGMALNSLNSLFTLLVLSILSLLSAYISYRLYDITTGRSTAIIHTGIATNLFLAGAMFIIVNLLVGCTLFSISPIIYTGAWISLIVGLFSCLSRDKYRVANTMLLLLCFKFKLPVAEN